MEIPVNDRNFSDININSCVKYYLGYDECLFGTVKWTGVDESRQYLYGLELVLVFTKA